MFNIKKFWKHVNNIYPSQLNVENTHQPDSLASYLHLTFTVDKNGKFFTKLYDKRDDFDMYIVSFYSSEKIFHLALLIMLTSSSSSDTQGAAHIMIISYMAMECQLKDFYLRGIDMNALEI